MKVVPAQQQLRTAKTKQLKIKLQIWEQFNIFKGYEQ